MLRCQCQGKLVLSLVFSVGKGRAVGNLTEEYNEHVGYQFTSN